MDRRALLLTTTLLCLSTSVFAAPGPDPASLSAGSHTGCVPERPRRAAMRRQDRQAVARVIADVVKCHVRQADARFSSVVGGSPRTFDEEACAAKARGKIDRAFASFEVNDICTGAATAAATAARRRPLLRGERSQCTRRAERPTLLRPDDGRRDRPPPTRHRYRCRAPTTT